MKCPLHRVTEKTVRGSNSHQVSRGRNKYGGKKKRTNHLNGFVVRIEML